MSLHRRGVKTIWFSHFACEGTVIKGGLLEILIGSGLECPPDGVVFHLLKFFGVPGPDGLTV